MNTAAAQPLDAATIQQLTWKPDTSRLIAVRIAQMMLDDRIVYPDEIKFDDIAKPEKNCIGISFRRLRAAGIIEACPSTWRHSKSKKANGRMIHGWRLKNLRLAETFLSRNGGLVKPKQTQLPFETVG